ncbi:MAG: branched-chain amino acid aminotransferase [Christensenellaceae bacterium]
MKKNEFDFQNLPVSYMKTPFRFVARYKDGIWEKGKLTRNAEIVLSESAGVLQYAQTCFEGLKAYTAKDGKIVCFRPDLNAERMEESAKRLEMPVYPKEKFLDAVRKVVRANEEYVPPYGSGAALYLRPFLFATGNVLGVKPASEYEFRIFASPVGPYFKSGIRPVSLKVSPFDRAAPHGTGHVKAGLNYAMSLYSGALAHAEGYDENLYLDAATRTCVEETGGANFIFVTRDGKFVTPASPTILPSITRRSLAYVAEHYLGMPVEERPVPFKEVPSFSECGLCGTAAVLTPVGKIVDGENEILFSSSETLIKLKKTLTAIQLKETDAPENWIFEIK